MARTQRQPPPPPPTTHSHSSGEEEEEEVDVTLSSSPGAKAANQEPDGDESDSSSSESEPEPPTKTPSSEPSESEDVASDEEEEEDEEPTLAEKQPAESEPLQKKMTSLRKPTSIIQRIWSLEDEMELLRRLSHYRAANGKLPTRKDYAAFLSTIRGSIGFNVTEMQLFNKIRHLKYAYGSKKKKGFEASSSNPHEREMYAICGELFEGGSKKSDKNGIKRSTKGASTGNTSHGSDGVGSNLFLGWLIEDFKKRCFPGLSLGADDLIGMIGSSKLNDLEARAKILRIEAMKFDAELMKLFVDVMTNK